MRLVSIFCCILFFCSCSNNQKNNSEQIVSADSDRFNKPIEGAVVAPPLANAPVEAAKLIIPAKQIGLTAIDETVESISKKLGRPDEGDAAMGKEISTWYSKNDKAHSTTIYFTTNFGDSTEAKRVSQVRITSPYFSTAEHLAVGSKFSEIQKAFPSLKLSGNYPGAGNKKTMFRVYEDVDGGIAFEIDPEDVCVGITVHKHGEKAFQTYLNFLPGYKAL